jgi:photosystem II stability/assembly factor-like uncharacterized protein
VNAQRRTLASALAAGALMLSMLALSPASGHAATMTRRAFLKMVKGSPAYRLMSGMARTDLRLLVARRIQTSSPPAGASASPSQFTPTSPAVLGPPPNLRVNDPAGDGVGDPDMTTQNEVSIATFGSNVVAAYNDDGTSPRPSSGTISPATNISGYSWSNDGGTTWHDSELPNHSPRINSGDPVVVADRAGHFFYSELSMQFGLGRIDVAVGRSDDGGQTFSSPRALHPGAGLTLADKPWMTVGPDPSNPSADIVYVGWQETFFDPTTGETGSRIVLSSSRDAGATWTGPVTVLTQPLFQRRSISFVNGTGLTVDPATGRLYVAWEQLVEPPHGGGKFPVRREWIARSDDGGQTFSGQHIVARIDGIGINLQACGNSLRFGPGRLVRVNDFPSLGVGPGGIVLMAFNSGESGASQVEVASSLDGGDTWSRTVVSGPPESFMPDLSADATGASVVYYQRASGTRTLLQTELATSSDGMTWSNQDLSGASFPVPITYPQTDPLTAQCYMGDYVASLRSGGTTYTGWGDNRDTVTNAFWPQGRADPDVYFAKA